MLVKPELFAILKKRSEDYAAEGYPICDPLVEQLLPRIEAHPNLTIVFSCEGHADKTNPRMTLMFACLDAEAVVKVEQEYIKLVTHLRQLETKARPVYDEMYDKHGDTRKVYDLIARKLGRNYYDRIPSLMIEVKYKAFPSRKIEEHYLARTIAAMVPTEISKAGLWDAIDQVFFR